MTTTTLDKPASASQNFTDTGSIGGRKLASLPASAQAKFEKLRRQVTLATALSSGLREEAERVRDNLAAVQRDLAIFDRRFPAQFEMRDGERVDVPYPERQQLVERIDSLKAEMARLNAAQADARIGFSISNILDWLADQRSNFKAAPLVKLSKADISLDTLAKIRTEQSAVRDELAAIENARLTTQEAKAALRDEIAAIAETGRPNVEGLFHGHPTEWPTRMLVASGHGAHQYTVAATERDVFSLFVWVHADQLTRMLADEIDAMGNDENALTSEARKTRASDANARLIALMRREEAIIDALYDAGHTVPRINADPAILLGLE